MAKKFDINTVEVTPTQNTLNAILEDKPEEVRKTRREYTTEEKIAALQDLRTKGKKGIKLSRLNLGLTPDNMEYVQTMALAQGLTITEFFHLLITQSRALNEEKYQEILKNRENPLI